VAGYVHARGNGRARGGAARARVVLPALRLDAASSRVGIMIASVQGVGIVTLADPRGGTGMNAQFLIDLTVAGPISIGFPAADGIQIFTGLTLQNLDAFADITVWVVYDPTGIVGGPYDLFPIFIASGAVVTFGCAPPYLGSFDLGVGFGARLDAPPATAHVAGMSFGYYFTTPPTV